MDEHFFTGRKETAVKPGEIIVSINIPFSNEVSKMLDNQLIGLQFSISLQM